MKNKIIYIEWIDSISRQGWEDLDGDYDITLIKSIGYLVSENEKCISITTSLDLKFEMAVNIVVIPKSAIKKRKFVKI